MSEHQANRTKDYPSARKDYPRHSHGGTMDPSEGDRAAVEEALAKEEASQAQKPSKDAVQTDDSKKAA